jgi:hypothetical protein
MVKWAVASSPNVSFEYCPFVCTSPNACGAAFSSVVLLGDIERFCRDVEGTLGYLKLKKRHEEGRGDAPPRQGTMVGGSMLPSNLYPLLAPLSVRNGGVPTAKKSEDERRTEGKEGHTKQAYNHHKRDKPTLRLQDNPSAPSHARTNDETLRVQFTAKSRGGRGWGGNRKQLWLGF